MDKKNRTILIFEDDKKFKKELLDQLHHYRCEIVSDIDDLYTVAQDLNPHVIILDLTLPLRRSFLFLEKRASDPILSKVPIIVTVEEKDEIRQLRGIALGASSYIKKPFRAALAKKQVERILAEDSFIKFSYKDPERSFATVSCDGRLKLVGEIGFSIEIPIRFKPSQNIKVQCPIFKELDIEGEIMKTSTRRPIHVSSGIFNNEVLFFSIDERKAKKIRQKTLSWGRNLCSRIYLS